MQKVRRQLAWISAGVLVVLGPLLPAFAHATLVKSSPAAGATLAQSPSEIRAVFSEELAVKGSVMRLYDGADHLLATGGVDLKDTDHESMRILPPLLATGTYVVRWHAISADDNHVTEDSFQFSVQSAGLVPAPVALVMHVGVRLL